MSAFCDRLVTAPLSYTHTGLGAAHISRLLRAQVRYFNCRSAVCALIMEATRSFFLGASAPHRDKNISNFQNTASAPHLLVTESAADGCLATTNASGAQPPEHFGKKGESSAPSAFHAFLGTICERPLIVLLCPALLTHTQNTEKRREQRALSLCLSLSHSGSRVSSASGLFFTLVCSTYLLTSRVLVNVGFVQTWCLVECDFFFFF